MTALKIIIGLALLPAALVTGFYLGLFLVAGVLSLADRLASRRRR